MGSLFKPQTTTVPASQSGSVKYDIPEYFKKAQEELFLRAGEESKKPYEAYTGERIAGMTQLQKDAMEKARLNLGAFEASGVTDKSRGLLDEATGVAGEQFTGATVDQYMNPWLQNVVDTSMRQLGETAGMERTGREARQVTSGAFGGDRAAMENYLANKANLTAAGDVSGSLYGAGFESGAGRFGADKSMRYADLINKAGTLPGLQLQLQGATMGEAEQAGKYGAMEQALTQAGYNEKYKDFIEEQGWVKGQLAYLSQILSGAPIRSYGQESTGTQDQVMGGTSTGGQIAGAIATYMALSDRRLKTDVELVGQSPSGINIYNFKYLNSNDTYQGVMAQEVLSATKLIQDYYFVDYSKLDVEFKKLNHGFNSKLF